MDFFLHFRCKTDFPFLEMCTHCEPLCCPLYFPKTTLWLEVNISYQKKIFYTRKEKLKHFKFGGNNWKICLFCTSLWLFFLSAFKMLCRQWLHVLKVQLVCVQMADDSGIWPQIPTFNLQYRAINLHFDNWKFNSGLFVFASSIVCLAVFAAQNLMRGILMLCF